MSDTWQHARAVADAVLYEGYLLYPYRASSPKNQSRWQFGVLGPPGAAQAGIGEEDSLSADLLVHPRRTSAITMVVRFLQLQHREAEGQCADGGSWSSWDEAVAHEIEIGPIRLRDLGTPHNAVIEIAAGSDVQAVDGGRLVRSRRALCGRLTVEADREGDLVRLTVTVRNTACPVGSRHDAIAVSLIGTHVIAQVTDGRFVSLLDPGPDAEPAGRCRWHRCFPVLAGPQGTDDLMLISPIILYDHPEIAEQSRGALFDSTEIDEILTLRVMTMTDEEKAQARATDPLAAEIIERCDAMSPDAMLDLHGVLRSPHGEAAGGLIPEIPPDIGWWDPAADNAVDPKVDAILVDGVRVSRGSRVRLHPSRRADAQDLFFADRIARVASVHEDVDGDRHVGVVLEDDPGADLHDSYGRYLYFAPDEVEPLLS